MAEMITTAEEVGRQSSQSFQRYYEEAGPDYAAWSAHFNMHFGFFRWGMNPFNREAMLERMNREVLERLHLSGGPARVLDMGCGLGATLGSIARRLPEAELFGITLVPWQLEKGRLLSQACGEQKRLTLALGDYEATEFPSQAFDAVYALESSCYGRGADKASLLEESYRLLRPGGRLVVADGFLGPGSLFGLQKEIYRRLLDCWVIDGLGDIGKFARAMERIGFKDIVVEQVQARVTPSVFHVPWVTLRFLLTDVLLGERKMTKARWNNVLAPILLPLVGFPLGPVAYYIVSGTRG